MSLHLEARPGVIAETVLIAGDPLRAKYMAENWLDKPVCYNGIRGMWGYTGLYREKKISIQGTGIGIPSTALYMHELIVEYKVKCIIRIGTCGAIQPEFNLGQLILADQADTDSGVVQYYQKQKTQLPEAHPELFGKIQSTADRLGIRLTRGTVFSTDLFYSEEPGRYKEVIRRGILAVDMETAMVFAMAGYFGVEAASILTVSDNIITGTASSAEDREQQTSDMVRLALEAVV
jgi:purine-nucleoside phosphorylase